MAKKLRKHKQSKEAAAAAHIKAQQLLRPTVQASIAIEQYSGVFGDIELDALIEALREQTDAANGGDLNRLEAMLAAQAHTLDAIFNNLARRAITSEYLNHLDTYLKLGLRAQSQCRSTIEALGELKSPKQIAFVNQANFAATQQVNNAQPRAGEIKNSPNKLLDQKHEQRLDKRTPSETVSRDPQMETVGAVNRTTV